MSSLCMENATLLECMQMKIYISSLMDNSVLAVVVGGDVLQDNIV